MTTPPYPHQTLPVRCLSCAWRGTVGDTQSEPDTVATCPRCGVAVVREWPIVRTEADE